jgi:hypothetical protein
LDEGYFQTSEESEAFRREYEMRRIKQAGFLFTEHVICSSNAFLNCR